MTTTIGGMNRNSFKAGLLARKKQIGFWLTADSLTVTEYAANVGFDWLLLDMEHTTLDFGRVEQHILAAKGGCAELVVRVPCIDSAIVKRLLDCGARSLMFPFVQSADEARLAAVSTLYPPRGIRGYSGSHRRNGYGDSAKDYLATYADEQCVIVQVESPTGVAAIPEISKIEGVDSIFVGPNDLSFNMGMNGDMSAPVVKEKIREALGLIQKGGKAAGILNFDREEARALLKMGFDHVAVHGDSAVLGAGALDYATAFDGRENW